MDIGMRTGTGKKATKITAETRVREVFVMLVNAATHAEILRYASEKGWGLSDRQVESYIQKATKRFHDVANFDREAHVGAAIARFEDLYKRCVLAQDFRGAASIQEKLCRLLGLEAPQAVKAEVSSPGLEEVIRQTHERIRLRHALASEGKNP